MRVHRQRRRRTLALGPVALATLLFAAVGSVAVAEAPGSRETAGDDASVEDGAPLSDALLAAAREPWTGDLPGMLERGYLRLATTYNPLFFSYIGFRARGMVADTADAFEKRLNKHHRKKDGHHIEVIPLQVPREELLSDVLAGRADLAAANITITPERARKVAFSIPIYEEARELIVTGPAAGEVTGFDDLVETGVTVLRSSSYFEHLRALNAKRRQSGKPAIPVHEADPQLADYDLLELIQSGTLAATVVDDYKARLWAQVLKHLVVHEDLAIHEGGKIAWALRKGEPELLKAVNAFLKDARKGTLLGNILAKRYLEDVRHAEDLLSGKFEAKLEPTLRLIRKSAKRYGFDWTLIAAIAHRESRFDQRKRNPSGALGIMQVRPSTARDPNIDVPDITTAAGNIEAGTKYLRFLLERYFSDEAIAPLDRILFAVAAYNAGPAGVNKARARAEKMGLEPNVWFDEVEVAAARTLGHQPVQYVRKVFKSYVVYKQQEKILAARAEALEAEAGKAGPAE